MCRTVVWVWDVIGIFIVKIIYYIQQWLFRVIKKPRACKTEGLVQYNDN